MSWMKVSSLPVECKPEHFASAIKIWLHRPNVCSKVISCAVLKELQGNEAERILKEALPVLKRQQYFEDLDALLTKSNEEDLTIYFRKLIPKKPDIHEASNELVILSSATATFVPLFNDRERTDREQTWYSIMCSDISSEATQINDLKGEHKHGTANTNTQLQLYVYCGSTAKNTNCQSKELKENQTELEGVEMMSRTLKPCFPTECWLQQKLMPQLVKWCGDEARNATMPALKHLKLPPSLSQIAQHKYAAKYQSLKQKYGPEMIKVWDEVTDPQKYIYEDVAIATYLILLWEKERDIAGSEHLQSFIDLGCGNGLLVHILNSEGHPGKGVDIRKRNIWDVYPATTNLVEGVVDPMSGVSYAEYDWLLGNHSDELTPWIPVMAARSGYHIRYWVLPCCFYDFFGKYERAQSTTGQYGDYLNFVKDVGTACGFDVQVDVMRIPSTKRVCHIGMTKTYLPQEHQDRLVEVEQYIEQRKILCPFQGGHFIAREKVERVRNCTKMDRTIQEHIVSLIVKRLLSESSFVKVDIGGSIKDWNKGRSVLLEEAVSWIEPDLRKLMKSECGGLQTLLKNHHQIFEVRAGNVQIRDWSVIDDPKRKRSRKSKKNFNTKKTRPCWFHKSHPDGCPRTAEDCLYLHDEKKIMSDDFMSLC